MDKTNALIFSKNDNVASIAFAELSLLGYLPKTIQEIPASKNVQVIVFDATKSELSPQLKSYISSCHNAKKIAIVNNSSEKLAARFDKVLSFPFLLSEFRESILNTGANQSSDNNSENSNTMSKIFIEDKDQKGVSLNDVFIPLSTNELGLLKLLCENSGKCVYRQDILDFFEAVDSNIAEVYICHLRNKLETPFGIKAIYTVRQKGYMTDYTMLKL